MYAQFPYNLSSTEADNWGWDEQPDPNPCQGQGTVTAGNTRLVTEPPVALHAGGGRGKGTLH